MGGGQLPPLHNSDVTMETKAKQQFTLVGLDGNAFCIMAYVNEAMRKCGVPPKERNAYTMQATGGDYNNLLAVSQGVLDRLNERGC